MITLDKKSVLVQLNPDYPENSPKKWRVIVGLCEFDEETRLEKLTDGEIHLVDQVVGLCYVSTWSGKLLNGKIAHMTIFNGEHFVVRKADNGYTIAYVGKVIEEKPETTTTENVNDVKPVNPETELDAE